MKTLTLKPGIFNAELLAIIGTDKIGWSGDDHLNLVTALRTKLTDPAGKAAEFNEQQIARLALIFHPTSETQQKVFKDTLNEAGYELDESTCDAFALLLSV